MGQMPYVISAYGTIHNVSGHSLKEYWEHIFCLYVVYHIHFPNCYNNLPPNPLFWKDQKIKDHIFCLREIVFSLILKIYVSDKTGKYFLGFLFGESYSPSCVFKSQRNIDGYKPMFFSVERKTISHRRESVRTIQQAILQFIINLIHRCSKFLAGFMDPQMSSKMSYGAQQRLYDTSGPNICHRI